VAGAPAASACLESLYTLQDPRVSPKTPRITICILTRAPDEQYDKKAREVPYMMTLSAWEVERRTGLTRVEKDRRQHPP